MIKNRLILYLGLTLLTVPAIQAGAFGNACSKLVATTAKLTFFGAAGLVGTHYPLLLELKNDFMFYKLNNKINQHETRIVSLEEFQKNAEQRLQRLEQGKYTKAEQPQPQIADTMSEQLWQWKDSLFSEENLAAAATNIEAIKYSGQRYGKQILTAISNTKKPTL